MKRIPVEKLMPRIDWYGCSVLAEFRDGVAVKVSDLKVFLFPKGIAQTNLFRVFCEKGCGVLKTRDSAESESWKVLLESGHRDELEIIGVSKRCTLFIRTSVGGNTARISEINSETGEEIRVVFEDEERDAMDVIFDKDENVIAVSVFKEHYQWKVLDKSAEEDFRVLEGIDKGDIFIDDVDNENNRWIVRYHSDTIPDRVYVYDRNNKKAEFFFMAHEDLKNCSFSPMKPVVIKARDGLEMLSYLTIPHFKEPKDLPLVLFVHGGPSGWNFWGFEEQAQFFADRGFAVLQVNFRGSGSFGKSYMVDGQWGGKLQEDLVDAVNWAIDNGIADSKKIVIYGGSYGGYAAVAGLTFTPDLFCCAVALCGCYDLKTDTEFQIKRDPGLKEFLDKDIGPVLTDEKFNREISPMFHVNKIKVPLFIVHGEKDPICNIEESERLAAECEKYGKDFEFVVYKDEPHGFFKPENCIDLFKRIDAFLLDVIK